MRKEFQFAGSQMISHHKRLRRTIQKLHEVEQIIMHKAASFRLEQKLELESLPL